MSLTSDGLVIVFQTFRSGGGDVYQATRPTTSVPFGVATPIAELNTTSNDGAVSITDDGLEVVFFSNRTGPYDIYHARRASTAAAFPMPTLALTTMAPGFRDAPEVSADGLAIYYTYGSGTRDIHRASRTNLTSQFTDEGPVVEINSAQDDALAAVSSDGLELVFQSNRGGANRLYVAKRASTSSPFDPPQPLSDLDALGASVSDPELADNGRELYFTLDTGSRDIWSARRPCN
jgi:Tol biopolymer transport system component